MPMETEIFKALSDIHRLQSFDLLLIALALVVGVFTALLGSYAKRKGENLATREDFEVVLRQVQMTTAATEQIKAQMSSQARVGESELEYRKAQLAEFYGPIYANLKTSKELYDIWIEGKLQSINKEIIELFRGQNEEMLRIISTKAHLVDGDTIPDVFTHFMTSVTIWNFFTMRPDKPWIDPNVADLPQTKFPTEFRDYIFSKTQELKRRLDHLHEVFRVTDRPQA